MCEVTFGLPSYFNGGEICASTKSGAQCWFGVIMSSDWGGYLSVAFVSVSLRIGSLLKPMIELLVKRLPQSELLDMMFPFLWMIFLMLGLYGL